MRWWVASATAAAVLAIGGPTGADDGQSPQTAEIEWLSANAIPFDTPVAGTGHADLQPLQAIIGEARVVGLGEATHGTREHFQMKHRLVEFLVTEMGFTVFSIEANTPEAYRLNDYVLSGEGDPEALIAGMYFWTWNTGEVLALVEWMRRFNASGGGPIQFTGFDVQTPDVAADIVVDFLAGFAPKRARHVRLAYNNAVSADPKAAAFGIATWSFPVEDARGRHLKYTGYIKTKDLRGGWAGLWWRVDCGNKTAAAFDNMMGRGPSGTTLWNRYTIELDIPESATNINFGVIMPGDGIAWFDKLRVELDGEEYAGPPAFDFDFESETIAGYYASNVGVYRASLDSNERYSGGQSLRLEKVADEDSAGAAAEDAARAVQEILETMQANRRRYLDHADAADVEWAIHNARVVAQCMRLRAGNGALLRDRFMAENVQWIAEQNPDAKIILWAHNGHIARLDHKMGRYLHERFGQSYVPVGFTAATGRYRAVGGGGAGEHDLANPPEGSVESYFAATGMPRLMLDLRKVEEGHTGSGWLAEHRKMRWIGAMATDQQFFFTNIPEAFDVLIYFDRTSASVPLGEE